MVKIDRNGELEWKFDMAAKRAQRSSGERGARKHCGDYIVLAESQERFPGAEIRIAILMAFNASGAISRSFRLRIQPGRFFRAG